MLGAHCTRELACLRLVQVYFALFLKSVAQNLGSKRTVWLPDAVTAVWEDALQCLKQVEVWRMTADLCFVPENYYLLPICGCGLPEAGRERGNC
jgi:hypothetical protein